MTTGSFGSVVSLYRVYLRRVRRLQLPYVRHFFRIKASDDFRGILRCPDTGLRHRKMKRIHKDLCRIEAANNGSSKAFAHVLDIAYGRKGKLKWELMAPILSDPAQVPSRIIPSMEESRPPIYSSEMKALLTSKYSRKNKPLLPSSLRSPPTLPARADPSSEDARLLGTFSKRREINIRWRYFSREWRKVRPPLQLMVANVISGKKCKDNLQSDLYSTGVRGLSMQGYSVFDDIKAITSPYIVHPPFTRRERSANNLDTKPIPIPLLQHSSRWMRRRYQELLARIPVLTYTQYLGNVGQKAGTYSVSLSSNAIAPLRFGLTRPPKLGAVADCEWLHLLNKGGSGKHTKS